MSQIQLFVPSFRIDECLQEIRECFEKGWPGLGFKTTQFEEAWKQYTGFPNAHFLNSATSALHLAVKLLKEKYGWKDGDSIISTPLTFVSTNHAISYENMLIKFADVDQYLCLDPDSAESLIDDTTRAIMFVGIGGNIGQYYKIVELCKKYNLSLILDAAHMAGTRVNGIIPGKEADVVTYSFQAVKNLPTADSGMICFMDEDLDKKCRKVAWMGINKDTYSRTNNQGAYKWKYDVEMLGHKYHGNSIMAAIALVQLKYLDMDNSYRKQIVNWYNENFKNKVKSIPIAPNCDSSNHLYIIDVDNRDELILALNQVGISPGVHYILNTNYSMYNYAKGSCPNAETLENRILSLPLHLKLSKNDVDYISENVIKLVNSSC